VQRLQESYVLKDLKKYRRFPSFLDKHKELFTTLPQLTGMAAREMLTVGGVPKRTRQRQIWKTIRQSISPLALLRLVWDGWRSVK
jgi:electron transfer flavoprotein-quinone oxidoreductase